MTKQEMMEYLLTPTPEVIALGKIIDEHEARMQEYYELVKEQPIAIMFEQWLKTFDKKETRTTYERIIKTLFDNGTLDYTMTIFDFGLTRAEGVQDWVLESIRKTKGLSKRESIHRQDIYVSFTKYLHAMTGGWFRRARFRCKCGNEEEPTFGDYYPSKRDIPSRVQVVTNWYGLKG